MDSQKKRANHAAAVALHFAPDNPVRVHTTLQMMPAMALEIRAHIWTVGESLEEISDQNTIPRRRTLTSGP
jgi:hypothetical protein